MNKRNKIIVSIVGITIVLLALLGITYAYYLTRIEGNTNTNSISVTTAKLELIYDDNHEEIIEGTGVLVPKIGTETEDAIGTKTFTVTNNGNDSSYVVVIDNVSTKIAGTNTDITFLSNDFRYTLSCIVKDKSGNILEDESCNQIVNLDTFPIKGGVLVGNNIPQDKVHEYTLTLWYIDTGKDQSDDMGKAYQARVNIKDMTSVNPFMTGVTATDNKSLVYNIINNAKTNKNGTKFVNVPFTTPAIEISGVVNYKTTGEEAPFSQEILMTSSYASKTWYYYETYEVNTSTGKFTLSGKQSCIYSSCYSDLVGKYLFTSSESINTNENDHTSDIKKNASYIYKILETTSSTIKYVRIFSSPSEAERVLAPTMDDYGTSYYFRGDVEDNYVNFAGMCWRIVRIGGDGSTKLILEDQYTVCDDETVIENSLDIYTGAWDIEASDGINITMNGDVSYRTGTFGFDSSSGIYKQSYLNPVDYKDRSMVNAFKYFQNNTLSNKISLNYNGKTISDFLVSGNWCLNNKTYSDSKGILLLENPDYSFDFFYDSSVRLYTSTIKSLTLKCPVKTMEKFDDDLTPMYVGTLTADEMVYAGGKMGSVNNNFYLKNKWQTINSIKYWSLSPKQFSSTGDSAFLGGSNGSIGSDFIKNINYSFRPTISLKSGAVITSGVGTLKNPYVIG